MKTKEKKSSWVTTLDSILGKTVYELEQSLGFRHGYLAQGFNLYALSEEVHKGEFIWRDKTRYSAGLHADPSIKFGPDPNVIWQVPRQDELRAALGRKLNYDEKAVDSEIDEILERSLKELNVRTGPGRIVRVVRLVEQPHRSDDYPNARSGNIPQWELTVEKQYTLIGKFHGPVPSHP